MAHLLCFFTHLSHYGRSLAPSPTSSREQMGLGLVWCGRTTWNLVGDEAVSFTRASLTGWAGNIGPCQRGS
jgi:hypothetical protein